MATITINYDSRRKDVCASIANLLKMKGVSVDPVVDPEILKIGKEYRAVITGKAKLRPVSCLLSEV